MAKKEGLSEEALRNVADRVAPAVHDAWAARRRAEGWRLGARRDDEKKEHPLLVPWSELPESEREYDRVTALTVLRALDAEGWRFVAPDAPAGTRSNDPRAGARAALEAGEPLAACDLLSTARSVLPGDPELRRLHALALARAGAGERARSLLEGLVADGHRDGETLGLLARTAKDAAVETADAATRRARFADAQRLYEQAFAQVADPWTAVNAGAMAMLAGDPAKAREHASKARALASSAGADDYWTVATLAEAALLSGSNAEAAARYGDAVRLAGTRWGSIASTRRNAVMLLEALGPDPAILDALTLPGVASLEGRPAAGSAAPPSRRAALRAELSRRRVGFAYVSPVSGEDVVLAEEALALGIELSVVLPCEAAAFLDEHPPEARDRLASILSRASRVVAASGSRIGGALSDEYASRMASGLAANRALQLGAEHVALPREAPAAPSTPGPIGIRAFLFSDTLGYSKLTDEQVAVYMDRFLGAIGTLVRAAPSQPIVRNTWGDAIYLAFADIAPAAHFALDLRDRVAQADWTAHGLPGDLTLRIALHAGPAYETVDAVTGATNIFGAHVSRAARIEPVTPPGEVYASEAFAALAAPVAPELAFEYVGQLPLAKGYGTFPTWHVRRKRRSPS